MDIKFVFHEGVRDTSMIMVVDAFVSARGMVQSFFNSDMHGLSIDVAASHEKMCEILGYDRPKYGVTTYKGETIYLYDPSKWSLEETGHTPEDIVESISHQLAHIFMSRKGAQVPPWFDDGVAVYIGASLSKQRRDNDFIMLYKEHGIPDLYNNLLPLKDHNCPALSYLVSYRYIEYLIDAYGKGKLLELIEKTVGPTRFGEVFHLTMGINVEQSWKIFVKQQQRMIDI